jgi:hypothetical protein
LQRRHLPLALLVAGHDGPSLQKPLPLDNLWMIERQLSSTARATVRHPPGKVRPRGDQPDACAKPVQGEA